MIKIFDKFFKKNSAKSTNRPVLEVDIHSHLIPGIDDGSKAMYESIKLIAALKELGYKKLITTPHIMSHRYKNSADIILEKLDFLRDALEEKDVDMELDAAAEYYLDNHFLALLKRKELMTFNENHVLFELSYTRAPVDLENVVFDMMLAGYTPVLAHPERYIHMHKDFSKYEELKEHGVLFQLNINSLGGYYSKRVQKVAEKLVDEGMIDYLGTDTHHMQHIESLQEVLSSPIYGKIFEKNDIRNNQLLQKERE